MLYYLEKLDEIKQSNEDCLQLMQYISDILPIVIDQHGRDIQSKPKNPKDQTENPLEKKEVIVIDDSPRQSTQQNYDQEISFNFKEGFDHPLINLEEDDSSQLIQQPSSKKVRYNIRKTKKIENKRWSFNYYVVCDQN